MISSGPVIGLVGALIFSVAPGFSFLQMHDYVVDPETNKLQIAENGEPEKTLLITIDDAPVSQSTPKMLEVLDRHDVRALFFLNGYLFDDRDDKKELVREIHRKGHLLGNHTWSHISLTKLDSLETVEEIQKLQTKVEDIVGYRPFYFRPPYGEHNEYLWGIMHELNMQAINWSLMSFDWNFEDTDEPDDIVELTLDQVHDGANMLFHDRRISAKALDKVLNELIDQGYRFVLPAHPDK